MGAFVAFRMRAFRVGAFRVGASTGVGAVDRDGIRVGASTGGRNQLLLPNWEHVISEGASIGSFYWERKLIGSFFWERKLLWRELLELHRAACGLLLSLPEWGLLLRWRWRLSTIVVATGVGLLS